MAVQEGSAVRLMAVQEGSAVRLMAVELSINFW
jgi:hypothetical protein